MEITLATVATALNFIVLAIFIKLVIQMYTLPKKIRELEKQIRELKNKENL